LELVEPELPAVTGRWKTREAIGGATVVDAEIDGLRPDHRFAALPSSRHQNGLPSLAWA
jgi:hypothetical protein